MQFSALTELQPKVAAIYGVPCCKLCAGSSFSCLCSKIFRFSLRRIKSRNRYSRVRYKSCARAAPADDLTTSRHSQPQPMAAQALADLDLLDTPPETDFEGIVHLASTMCEMPVAWGQPRGGQPPAVQGTGQLSALRDRPQCLGLHIPAVRIGLARHPRPDRRSVYAGLVADHGQAVHLILCRSTAARPRRAGARHSLRDRPPAASRRFIVSAGGRAAAAGTASDGCAVRAQAKHGHASHPRCSSGLRGTTVSRVRGGGDSWLVGLGHPRQSSLRRGALRPHLRRRSCRHRTGYTADRFH